MLQDLVEMEIRVEPKESKSIVEPSAFSIPFSEAISYYTVVLRDIYLILRAFHSFYSLLSSVSPLPGP